MPLFLDSFWDGYGFEVLNKHMVTENEFVNNLAQFVHAKANLDAEYSKGLLKLVKNYATTGKEELGTMRECWETLKTELEGQAKLIQTLSTELDELVAKQFAHLRDEQTKARKNTEKKMVAAEKSLQATRSAQKKAEKSAWSCEKSLEGAYEAHEKSGGDPKTEKNLKKAQAEAEKQAAEFKQTTKKAHQEKVRWEDSMINMTLEFEQLEKERFKSSKENLTKYVELHSQLYPQLQESQDRIRQAIEKVNDEGDIQLFVDQKQTGPTRPEELLYKTYALDGKNPMNPERRKATLSQNILELEQDIESERRGIAGVENLLKVYSNQPSYTNDAGMITSQRQLVHLQEYMGTLQNHLHSYEEYLGNLGGSRPAPGTLPTSHSHSTQSTYSMIAPSFDQAGAATRPDPPAAAPAAPATGSGERTCTVLYDFDATNEGEISVKEGNEAVVLDASDADWVRILLDGMEGYVPANYIQIN